ncbi:hypothetical protein F383_15461 [Gossypium arboreum]|uniref:Uncharacterized protein n=1 Tax=Gossypium arboreum TaxID=29729 RepID=A0A0B0MI67_GOSAR|nr:hypothetical protein F383_16073 [Gossypium arboreum]KHG11462.1 hypothetical protein F383_15461 [Gossypium arboreum]
MEKQGIHTDLSTRPQDTPVCQAVVY